MSMLFIIIALAMLPAAKLFRLGLMLRCILAFVVIGVVTVLILSKLHIESALAVVLIVVPLTVLAVLFMS